MIQRLVFLTGCSGVEVMSKWEFIHTFSLYTSFRNMAVIEFFLCLKYDSVDQVTSFIHICSITDNFAQFVLQFSVNEGDKYMANNKKRSSSLS